MLQRIKLERERGSERGGRGSKSGSERGERER